MTSRLGTVPAEAVKTPVVTVTEGEIVLMGLQTINGVLLNEGDRVLVANQPSSLANGIYIASPSEWYRSTDWNGERDVVNGALILTTHDGSLYRAITGSSAFTVGSSSVTFALLPDIVIDAQVTEEHISTAGQTVFTTTQPYVVGSGNLQVYVDGVLQSSSIYTETDSNTVTFDVGQTDGAIVTFVITQSVQSTTYDAATVTYTTAGGSTITVEEGLNTIPTGLTLTGDVEGVSDFTSGGAATMSTALTLPAVTEIRGGSASTFFVGATSGPYGVGDTITNVPDTYEYCPGYTYTYISTSSFSIEDYNVTNLFSVNRRLKITDNGATIYGLISAVDYDITSTGDTTVTLVMEDAAVLSADLTEVCMVAGNTSWSPISETPFGNYAILDVVAGKIGTVTYWIICGVGGRLAYSIDAGITWTLVTTGTVENLQKVAYDSTNEEFMVAGSNAVTLVSSDGTNWTLGTVVTITAGSGDIKGLVWVPSEARWHVLLNSSLSSNLTYFSSNLGTTWTYADTVGLDSTLTAIGEGDGGDDRIYLNDNGGDGIYYWIDADDNATTLAWNPTASTVTALNVQFLDGTTEWFFLGRADNLLTVRNQSTGTYFDDSVTFAYPARSISYSSFLGRAIVVGDNAQLAYIDPVNFGVADAWTAVSNGLDPTSNFTAIYFDDGDDRIFIAVADNGQILRSTNGVA